MKKSIACLVLATALLGGCQTRLNNQLSNLGGPDQLDYPTLKYEGDKVTVDIKADISPELNERLKVLNTVLEIRHNKDDRTYVPREVAGFLIGESDRKCDQFMTRANSNRNAFTTSLGTLALLTGAAATVPTGGQTANVLSAVGTGALGSSQLYERNFFNERGAELVLEALNNRRSELRGEFVQRLGNGHYDNLPFSLLMADVEAYHSHCGITVALADLERAVREDETRQSMEMVMQTVESSVSTAQTAWCDQGRAAGLEGIDQLPACASATSDDNDDDDGMGDGVPGDDDDALDGAGGDGMPMPDDDG